LEDNLMRLFGSERIAKLMDKMGYEKGEVIQHSMVTKSIERAQSKVEENHFGVRKRLLEYDDVMNIQREAIYKKRRNAMMGERLSLDVHNMFVDLSEEVFFIHHEYADYDAFKLDAFKYFGVEPKFEAVDFKEGNPNELVEVFSQQVVDSYHQKMSRLVDSVMPVIQDVHKNQGQQYTNIAIPFTDGQKGIQLSASLEDAVNSDGKSVVSSIEKSITLALIDDGWKDHLRAMDDLKEATQAASFEQKDPLVVYKIEAFELFKHRVSELNGDVTSFLSRGSIPVQQSSDVREAKSQKTDLSKTSANRQDAAARAAASAGAPQKVETFKRSERKVGRNEPCPCGSGKKFKQCHGKR